MEDSKQEAGANSQKFSPSSVSRRIKGFDLVNSIREVAVVAFTPPKREKEELETIIRAGINNSLIKDRNSQNEIRNKEDIDNVKQLKQITDLHKAPEIKGVEDGAGTMILELKLN